MNWPVKNGVFDSMKLLILCLSEYPHGYIYNFLCVRVLAANIYPCAGPWDVKIETCIASVGLERNM